MKNKKIIKKTNNVKIIGIDIIILLIAIALQPLLVGNNGVTAESDLGLGDENQSDQSGFSDPFEEDPTKPESNDCGCNPSKPSKLDKARANLYPYPMRILLSSFDNVAKIGRSSEPSAYITLPEHQDETLPCPHGECTTIRFGRFDLIEVVHAELHGIDCSGFDAEEEIQTAIQQALLNFKEHFNEVNEGNCGDSPCECLCPNPNPFLCYTQTIFDQGEANLIKPLGPNCEVRVILTVHYRSFKFEGECGKLNDHPDWSPFPTEW